MQSITSKLLIGLSIIIFFDITGCKKDNDKPEINTQLDDRTKNVQLISDDKYAMFEKTIVMFDDENYIVKSPLNLFISDLDDYYVDYTQYLNTIESIVHDAKLKDILYATDYYNNADKDYILAHILESGNCFMSNKKESRVILQIVVEEWGGSSGPLSGSGGRNFYVEGKLFLRTTDWISK